VKKEGTRERNVAICLISTIILPPSLPPSLPPPLLQPHSSYFKYLTPPAANLHNPISSLPLFHLRSIVIRDKEKQKGPIFVAKWDPTGRRLLTGSESGYVVVIQGTPIKTWMVRREREGGREGWGFRCG